jgi:hypothetical protein
MMGTASLDLDSDQAAVSSEKCDADCFSVFGAQLFGDGVAVLRGGCPGDGPRLSRVAESVKGPAKAH